MEETMPECPGCESSRSVEVSMNLERGTHYCYSHDCEFHFTPIAPEIGVPEPDNQMYRSMKATFSKCLAICAKKGHDYAGVSDPYKNFETVQRIGVTVQQGIFIRTLDKITRLENLLTTAPYVTEEAFEDTIDDAINYLAILKARREMERN